MNRKSIYLLALGVFLVATAELVVAGILSEVAADLHVSIASAGQLVTAYSLAFAIGTPILIALTSRVGRKQLLIVTLAIFAIGSTASFLSFRYEALLAARVVLGLSAGVYCVVAISSVAKLVPPDKMGSAIGTIALAFGSALTLGVPIGIAISHWMDWRTIFALLGIAARLYSGSRWGAYPSRCEFLRMYG